MGVADDLRSMRERQDEIVDMIGDLSKRLASLEAWQAYEGNQSALERGKITRTVEAINTKLDAVKAKADAVENKIEGGKLVIRALWWAGGIIGAAAAHFSGLLHHFLPFIPPPR